MKWLDERGSALMVVFMVTLVTFMLGSALLSIATLDKKISINQTDEMKALNIAEAGADMAIAMLKRDPEKLPVIAANQPIGEGNLVSVTVTKNYADYDNKTLDIVSKGKVKGIEKVIDVRLEVDILPSFDFGRGFTTGSGSTISLSGSASMDTNIRAKGDIVWDNSKTFVGSVYTEGSFTVNHSQSVVDVKNDKVWANVNVTNQGSLTGPIEARGNVTNGATNNKSAVITGNIKAIGNVVNYGTIIGNVTAGGNVLNYGTITGEIRAGNDLFNYSGSTINGVVLYVSTLTNSGTINPTNASNPLKTTLASVVVAQYVAPQMPELDRKWFEDSADLKYNTSTTLNLSSLGNLGERIIFVNGDLNLFGTYEGRGAVVVLGNISFSGDVLRKDPSATSKDSLAIISLRNDQGLNGNMSLSGGRTIDGLILCDGTFTLSGNATVNGALIIRNYGSNGGPVITYNPTLTSATPLGLPGNFRIISWQEKYN